MLSDKFSFVSELSITQNISTIKIKHNKANFASSSIDHRDLSLKIPNVGFHINALIGNSTLGF